MISDGLIAISYFSIPLTLLYLVRRRKDLAFNWLFLCFAVFIVACGARQRHQHTIRTFYGFRACDSAASRLLLKEIASLVRSQVKPKVIFWRCIDVLVREKIEVPSYTRLTKLILGAINRRNQELAAIIERSLTQEVRALLEDLLRQEPLVGDSVPGKTSAYKLTLRKKLSQSTKPSKVKERVVDLSLVRGLYDQLSPTLQSLALMPGGIRYYAESVLRSEIFQLTRRDDPDRYLHVIAFIAHQFYRLQDNLVDVLLPACGAFRMARFASTKSSVRPCEEQHEALKTLLGGIERGLVGTLTSIGSITENQALTDTEKNRHRLRNRPSPHDAHLARHYRGRIGAYGELALHPGRSQRSQ